MERLGNFRRFFTAEQERATDAHMGYLLEYAVKAYGGAAMKISEPGKTDLRFEIDGKRRYVEVKQNGGDFRHACKGNSYIFYAIYIDENKPLREQFGYVMPMKVFKAVGAELHLFRSEKKDSKGNVKMSLQTLYNYSKQDFHGAKAFKLADAWEAAGAIPFKDFFVEG